MNQMIDSDNLQIDENNELLDRILDAIEEETKEVRTIEDALKNANGEDLPALNKVLQGAFGSDGGIFADLMNNINKQTTQLIAVLSGTTVEDAEALLQGGSLTKDEAIKLARKLGYGFQESTGLITRQDFSTFQSKWKDQQNTQQINAPLGTAENGASVTGGGNNSNSSASSNGNGWENPNGFPRNGTVTTRSLPLNIRSGAGMNYRVIGSMPKGAHMTVTGENGSWAQISYNGINGWASKQYLAYDQGGLAKGKGFLLKDIQTPERILSPQQTKSFDTLVKNLTTNPVLSALTKNIKGTSKLAGFGNGFGETKQYNFSNFTVQADNITEFIDSIEGMIPISNG